MDLATLYGLALNPLILILLVIAARLIHGSWGKPFAISLLVGLLGTALGWLIALLGSPESDTEAVLFQEVSNVLIGLITGYLGARVFDPLLKALFEEAQAIKNPTLGVNVLIFLITLIVAVIGGYTYRLTF